MILSEHLPRRNPEEHETPPGEEKQYVFPEVIDEDFAKQNNSFVENGLLIYKKKQVSNSFKVLVNYNLKFDFTSIYFTN